MGIKFLLQKQFEIAGLVMIDGINNFVKIFVCDTDAMDRKVRIQAGCRYAAKLQAKDNAHILLMIVSSRPQEMLILLEHHDFLLK